MPGVQEILIEIMGRCTKDAIAELCKTSMLTQDSINEAVREVDERTGCVDGIEYTPQKRMIEADYLNFTVKREMQMLTTGGRFSLCSCQAGMRCPQRRFVEVVL